MSRNQANQKLSGINPIQNPPPRGWKVGRTLEVLTNMDRLSIFLKNKTMDFKFDKFHFPKIYLGTIRYDISLVP